MVSYMIGVFVSPCATFGSVRSRVGHADWLVPLILMVIATVVTVYLTLSIVMAHMEKISATGGMIAVVSAPVGVALALTGTFLGRLLSNLGFFSIWQYALVAKGLVHQTEDF